MRRLLSFLSAICGVLLLSSAAFAADSWLGTWKVNLTKSRFRGPAPRSLTLTFKATSAGTSFSSEGVSDEGKPTHTAWVSKLDGKDVPYQGNPNADTAAPRKIDANNYENTWKMGSEVTVKLTAVVSADGRTLTVTQKGKDSAKGRTIDITAVFDKQ